MTKRGDFFNLVKDEQLLEQVRDCMRRHLSVEEEDMGVPEGQPFRLGLLRRVLEEAGNCDSEFLRQTEKGGILNALPRSCRRTSSMWIT